MKKSKKEILNSLRREGSTLTPDVLNNIYKTIGVEPTLIGEKEKVIEQRLRAEADAFVPQDKAPVFASSQPKPRLSLGALFAKPRFVSLFATAMVAVILSVTLVALGINGFFIVDPTDTSITPTDTRPISVPQPIQNDQQVFSVGALTSNVLFDYVEQAPAQGAVMMMADPVLTDRDIIIPQLSPYFEMVEQLLTSGGQMETVSEISDRLEYDFKETITAYDALGQNLSYVIYYNVVDISEDEEEATYHFVGVISYSGSTAEYAIEGRRAIDEDGTKVSLEVHYSEGNYVRSEYITEEDGTKYKFRIYSDNKIVSSSKLKLEYDDDEVQLKFDFDDGDNKYRYDIAYDELNPKLIHVEYSLKIGNEPTRKGTIDILIVENEVTGEVKYEIVIKPEGGDEEHENEDRGHNHGNGKGNEGDHQD